MEVVFGIIVIIVTVAVIFGDGSSSGAPPTTWTQPAPRQTPPTQPRTYAPVAAHRIAHQREIERHQRADEAFFDGVVFGHYFLDGYGQDDEDTQEADAWDYGSDDDYDDGMYD